MYSICIPSGGKKCPRSADQRHDVLAALPQRRQLDRKHIQSIVQIAPKFVPFYRLFEIPVSRDQPDVQVMGAATP